MSFFPSTIVQYVSSLVLFPFSYCTKIRVACPFSPPLGHGLDFLHHLTMYVYLLNCT